MSNLRDFLEAELENRQSAGGDETDYVTEAREALSAFDALTAERDALKAERDMWEAEVTRIGEEWTKADDAHQRREAALATRDATIATLIEALGPFAKYANDWVTPRMYDSVRILDDNAAPVATVRAFRRARAALNSARSAHG